MNERPSRQVARDLVRKHMKRQKRLAKALRIKKREWAFVADDKGRVHRMMVRADLYG